MHSFENTLRAVCRDVKPMKIVEWGPGKSTAVMREECKDAIIISVEHHPVYARLARETGRADHVFEFNAAQPKSKYAVWPLECFDADQKIDLAFVDGRRRVECALVAAMIVRSGGAIVLHDAHRWHYREVLEHWLGKPEEKYAQDSMTKVWIVK